MKLEWEYQDCELGLHKGKCCQECVANGERTCCECRVDLEDSPKSSTTKSRKENKND